MSDLFWKEFFLKSWIRHERKKTVKGVRIIILSQNNILLNMICNNEMYA